MPTLAELRAKLPALEGLDDTHAVEYIHRVYYPKADPALIAQRLGIVPPAPPKPERGWMRAGADVALAGARGVGTGVRMLTDLAGADNRVSQGLRTADEAMRGLQSERAHADEAEVGQIMQDAEGQGILGQIGAAGRAFAVAPVSMAANAAGTAVPTIAAAMLPGGQALMASRLAAGTVGAAQGVGATKGAIYEATKHELLKAGEKPEVAEARAAERQQYANMTAGQLGGSAALGALAGSSGIERIVGMRGAGATGGALRRAAGGAVTEAIPETMQGGHEQWSANTALGAEGFDRDPMAGVVAQGALEGMASAPVGGAFGAMRPGDAVREAKVPETGPNTRALNAGVEAQAQEVDAAATAVTAPQTRRQEAAPTAEMLAALEPAARDEALQMLALSENPKVPAPVRRRAMNRLDVLLYSDAAIAPPGVEPVAQQGMQDEQPVQAAAPEIEQTAPELPRVEAPPPVGQQLPGDITVRGTGKPFKTMAAAMSALNRAGGEATHELVHVDGGLVVRAKEGANVGDRVPVVGQPAGSLAGDGRPADEPAPAVPARAEPDPAPDGPGVLESGRGDGALTAPRRQGLVQRPAAAPAEPVRTLRGMVDARQPASQPEPETAPAPSEPVSQAKPNAEQPPANPVAESLAPGRSADGDDAVARIQGAGGRTDVAWWDAASADERKHVMGRAGWSVDSKSKSAERVVALPWAKLSQGQKERLTAARTPDQDAPAASPATAAEPPDQDDTNQPPRAPGQAQAAADQAPPAEAGDDAAAARPADAAGAAPAEAGGVKPERTPRDIGREAGERGDPRDPPAALKNTDKQLWRAGWDESKKTAVTPQVPAKGPRDRRKAAIDAAAVGPRIIINRLGKDGLTDAERAAGEKPYTDPEPAPAPAIDDTASLAGKTVEIPVAVGDKTGVMKMDAAEAVRDVRKRLAAAKALLECLA